MARRPAFDPRGARHLLGGLSLESWIGTIRMGPHGTIVVGSQWDCRLVMVSSLGERGEIRMASNDTMWGAISGLGYSRSFCLPVRRERGPNH